MRPVVGPRLLIGSMEKTGTTRLRAVLRRLGLLESATPDRMPGGAHYRLTLARPWMDGRAVIGTVRDPWSWCCSYLAYMRRPEAQRRWLAPYIAAVGNDDLALLRAMNAPLQHDVKQDPGGHPMIANELGEELSLFTWLYLRVYCDENSFSMPLSEVFSHHTQRCLLDRAIDCAWSIEDLQRLLRQLGEDVTTTQIENAGGTHRVNASTWAHDVRKVYDDDTAEAVAAANAGFLGIYGYEFGLAPKMMHWSVR